MKNFPSGILTQIDSLWVKYSKGYFGFSVQKHIWESLGGKPDFNSSEEKETWNKNSNEETETWKKFGEQVGWYRDGAWETYNTIWNSYNTMNSIDEKNVGSLPVLYTTYSQSLHMKDGKMEISGGRWVGVPRYTLFYQIK